MSSVKAWFQQLPTAGKLLLLLTAAILPLGLVLVAAATSGINQANDALAARASDQGRLAIRAIDSLIGRNVLALRVAANGAIDGSADPCQQVQRALSSAPGTPFTFLLSDSVGTQLCARGTPDDGERPTLLVAPGQVKIWLSPTRGRLYYRVGVIGGSATGSIDRDQFRSALIAARAGTATLVLSDDRDRIEIVGGAGQTLGSGMERTLYSVAQSIVGGQLDIRAEVSTERIAEVDRLVILLPVLMWIVAALLSWLVVRTFLLNPLKRIQVAITAHDPGTGPLQLPSRLGSAIEIRELGASFSRAVERIEQNEKDMAEALEGQRKLVREVHHRVKNNLQVVASLLNIHRRSAKSDDAKDAYSSIGRRVDALAVVHRNHYAELEENRGIALRSLLSELAANLRGSAPDNARSLDIGLDLESINATQDVAVATAFLTTEVVEHAMLTQPEAPVTLTLRRTGDTTARFTLATNALSEAAAADPEHQQFERIIAGLAKQLRSTLDRAPGSYSVELPVYPPR
ncbi:sensor histidine kinase [Sphingomonas astaxanthinifaciens]|uniref:histidine kinase n=1 Tax=Sphingomonas astaxanthinifaciens DSM 22298 TaxID=1123267 RepID=A0ABQ5Z7K3_9SPHN|nr:sensor histidine kinase [Sphingomonas astaxanthinifaciens]GLR47516.1 hypothetical protein GCM10007925_12280 [Sphingomonas astaxanthinifaciens DSM 22298]